MGINSTRALTALNSRHGGFRLTPVGRVQTPTLTILANREREIANFVPRTYWEVHALFGVKAGEYAGRWFDEAWKKDELDEHSGRWLEIAPDRRLRLSWLHADAVPSLVTFDFRPAEGGTWLEVRHEELPDGEDGLYQGGWTQCLGNLTRILEP